MLEVCAARLQVLHLHQWDISGEDRCVPFKVVRESAGSLGFQEMNFFLYCLVSDMILLGYIVRKQLKLILKRLSPK